MLATVDDNDDDAEHADDAPSWAPSGLRGLQFFLTNFGPQEGASASPWVARPRNVSLRIRVPSVSPALAEAPNDSGPRGDPWDGGGAHGGAWHARCSAPTRALLRRIDDDATNPWAAWKAQGSPQYPTPAQLAALHEASEVPIQSVGLDVLQAGEATIELELPPYGIAHLSGFACDE